MITIKFNPDDYKVLNLQGNVYDSLQRTRITLSNRFGNPRLAPLVEAYGLGTHLESITEAEREAAVVLKQLYLGAVTEEIKQWQRASTGIGELQLARLLGRTGHPRVAFPKRWVEGDDKRGPKKILVEDEPYTRSLRQFWAFCGVGDPERKRVKNMTQAEALALGDPDAKKILWLIATSVMRASGGNHDHPRQSYRIVYDEARLHYQDRLHATKCVRCGPSGKPALEGSPWSDGHKHGAAIRKMEKEILRDLWIKGCEDVPIEEEEAARWREHEHRHQLEAAVPDLKTMTAGESPTP